MAAEMGPDERFRQIFARHVDCVVDDHRCCRRTSDDDVSAAPRRFVDSHRVHRRAV